MNEFLYFILGVSLTINLLVITIFIIYFEKKKEKKVIPINRSDNLFNDSWNDFWSRS